MIPTTLTLVNWMRFKGRHVVTLGGDIYSVLARLDTDEARSNWLGKTSFMRAIPFALYGSHKQSTEDDWITNGESVGTVELVLSDKTTITRERRRGKSTQLTVSTPDGRVLTKNEAQEYIVSLLQLSEADFYATCFFEQKMMHRFITARPADRMASVSAWLNLEPLQKCADVVGAKLEALTDERRKYQDRIGSITAIRTNTYERLEAMGLPGRTPKQVKLWLASLAKATKTAQATVSEMSSDVDQYAEWKSAAKDAERYLEVVARGKQLRAEVDATPQATLLARVEKLREEHQTISTDASNARTELGQLELIGANGFGGECPVMCQACPVADQVDKVVRDQSDRLADAERRMVDMDVAKRTSAASLAEAEQQLIGARDREARLAALREQAKVLHSAHVLLSKKGPPPDTALLERELEEAMQGVASMTANERQAKSMCDDLEKLDEEELTLATKSAELDDKIATHREAMLVFGRNGAQRATAEGALAAIEADANALLQDAGIDLALAVHWAHEASSGLATTCEFCGEPFPRSQKVKLCVCGAVRGPKMIEKLDIDLTDRSGAAEDLAGIGFQLAAAAWLRRERGSSWSAAFIDEPFGALDEANKRSLATHFSAMIRSRYGFDQCFVVAHDRGIMDALPGRIEIVGYADGSGFAE